VSDPKPSSAPSSAARFRLDDVARKYYAPLLAFFRKRTHNSLEVQDLVQQVFLRLSQYPEIERIENPGAYIFKTASNALKDMRKRELARESLMVQGLSETPEAEIDAGFSPERVVLGQEAMRVLVAALREVPEKSRDIFMLRCFEGLKHAEIAKVHHLSKRAVEKHVARVLARLKEAVESS